MEVKSLSKTQSVRGGMASNQVHANKLYSFMDKHVVFLFKLLQKSNKLKLPNVRRPEKVGKSDNLSYCLYHRMLGYPTSNCYIFKDIFQALIEAEVLKLRPEQKKVTANMTATSPIQFGPDLSPAPTRVVPILKGELRVINLILISRRRKVLSLFLLLEERQCGSILTLLKASNGRLSQIGSPKPRPKRPPAMW